MEDQPTSNTNSQGFLSEPRASFIELSPPNTSLGPTPPETEEGVPPYSDPSQEHSRRHRYELGSDARISSDINEEPPKVIWGTNIVITEIISALRLFFTSFFLENDIKGPKYLNVISEMPDREDYTMDLDCADLQAFAPTIPIFAQLVLFPQEVIPLMDFVANGVLQGISPSGSEQDLIQVRPFNLTSSVNLRELNPEDIDKYIRVKGLVIRASNLIPDMRVAYFVCRKCGDVAKVENLKGRINEPTRCQRQSCMAQNAYELCHNRCIFGDKQLIKIQETPDSVPEGQTPHSVTLCVYDSLMDFVRPGDRIEVCGIYRASPIRASQYQRRLKSVFRTYVDVVHIRKSHQGIVKSVRSLDDKVAAEGVFSENADVYQSLSNSIAPNIWKLENVKKALLLQLFGGISKVLSGSTSNRFRGDINILLAGDPGVSKSQLLGYVHNLAPRGVYTSGKGSSAVGLTAYIVRDPETNQLVLER
jgi:DNA replication licensing factor MCM4